MDLRCYERLRDLTLSTGVTAGYPQALRRADFPRHCGTFPPILWYSSTIGWKRAMPHYCAYILGKANSVQRVVDVDCEDGERAVQGVANMQPTGSVDLWQGKRCV